MASSRSSATSNRRRARGADAQDAEELVGREQRQADAAAHHELGAIDRRDAGREIFDDDGRARGDDLLARPRRRAIPETLHARRSNRRRHLVSSGPLVAQANRRADGVEGADDALQRSGQDVIELEGLIDALRDLVDGLEFPEQATVVNRHPVDEQRCRRLRHVSGAGPVRPGFQLRWQEPGRLRTRRLDVDEPNRMNYLARSDKMRSEGDVSEVKWRGVTRVEHEAAHVRDRCAGSEERREKRSGN